MQNFRTSNNVWGFTVHQICWQPIEIAILNVHMNLINIIIMLHRPTFRAIITTNFPKIKACSCVCIVVTHKLICLFFFPPNRQSTYWKTTESPRRQSSFRICSAHRRPLPWLWPRSPKWRSSPRSCIPRHRTTLARNTLARTNLRARGTPQLV